MKRFRVSLLALAAICLGLVLWGGPATAAGGDETLIVPKVIHGGDDDDGAPLSGTSEFKDVTYGNAITECPQAGLRDGKPRPLDRRNKDAAEKRSDEGGDVRANQDYACFPQNETSIDVSSTDEKNIVGGANDYRLGWGTSGFYSSTDNGEHWYDGLVPFPSLPSGDNLDGGGDPAIVFDREGTVYYNDINFNRTDDTSGVWVRRSTNGGFTWSRPCVAIEPTPPATESARCGGTGDPRQPGDGTVIFTEDNGLGTTPANDKEYIAAGPRPAGVQPVCFTPTTKTPTTCASDAIGPDRLYVTWTIFTGTTPATFASQIYFSFSDDRAHSWSSPKVISGSAPFCTGGNVSPPDGCDDNQFSVPTVNPVTGFLYVAFENFDTPDENQYLGVKSSDGGQTFQGPFFITPVFDVNYPRSAVNRQDCAQRGQQGGRSVLTNSCFRVNAGGNVVADKRGGAFADDLYLVMSDNRNGSRQSSNTDIFFFRSTDGGMTWIGPTRVNNDPSTAATLAQGGRDCGRFSFRVCPPNAPNFGNDQWFPWVDVSEKGDVNVGFEDRRLDTNSTAGEWPLSRAAPNGRPGNYLVWFFGAQCGINSTATVTATTTIPAGAKECAANEAAVIAQPTGPINPSSGAVVPGQNQTGLPFDNFQISDTASNWDYSFRAGIFAGDYSGLAVEKNQAYALWTDARNGRGSGGPTNLQPGRNPICEQSDAFFDRFSAANGGKGKGKFDAKDNLFLVTPCPNDIKDKKSK